MINQTQIQITDGGKLDIGVFRKHKEPFVRWFFNKIKHAYA